MGRLAGLLLLAASAGAVAQPTTDVDANGSVDALTDGLLVLRHLFGFSGAALTDGALGLGATRDAAQVASFLENNRSAFDLDGNGVTDALTDGLLLLRHLFGFSGEALIAGALGDGADPDRDSADEIEAYIAVLGDVGDLPALVWNSGDWDHATWQ